MGWAIAQAARDAGARVTLVAGPVNLPPLRGVRTIPVRTAREMERAALRAARGARAVIGAAAVADWRPARAAPSKIKKGRAGLSLRLVQNPDILKSLARARRGVFPRLAGFALETEHLLEGARRKMAEKNLDVIVANRPSSLGGTRTRAWILAADGGAEAYRGPKEGLAARLLDRLLKRVEAYE
jgi:phosphopantothenoylcysteine decarboxylase/phosphopantothenate--cysteine ligase